MAKRDRSDFSNAVPTLKPEDIAPAREAVLTCDGVEEREYDDGKRLFLHFEEFPDKLLRVPVTSLDELIEALGDDDDDWKTQIPVHVVKAMNPTAKKMQDVLHIVPASAWKKTLDAFNKESGKRGARSSRGKAARR